MRIYDPPKLLEYEWGGEVLRFELHARDGATVLVFTHTLGADATIVTAATAGWHSALDALAGRMAGDQRQATKAEVDARVAAGLEKIAGHPTLKEVAAPLKDPTPPDLAAELNRQFLAKGLHDYPGADWKEKLKKEYTDPLTAIGGSQDDMVGECRWVVKALRQKAGLLMATDPRMAGVAAELRARTQKVLRGGAAYEGARH